MILNRWQLVVTPTPHLHPLPFSMGRGNSSCWQAGRLPYNQTKYEIDLLPVHVVAASVCEACRCRFDRLLVTSPKYRYVSLAPTPRSQAEPGAMPQESGVADNQALKARRS